MLHRSPRVSVRRSSHSTARSQALRHRSRIGPLLLSWPDAAIILETCDDFSQATTPRPLASKTNECHLQNCQIAFSFCGVRQPLESFSGKKYRPPTVAKLRAQRPVHCDRFFVPVNHFPVYSVTLLMNGDVSYSGEQGFPDSSMAECRADEEIL